VVCIWRSLSKAGSSNRTCGMVQDQPLNFHCVFHIEGQRCELCLSSSHSSGECTLAEGDGDLQSRLAALESTRVMTRPGTSRTVPSGYEWTDICKLFNEGKCTYSVCKFRHACIACGGDHPAIASPNCGLGSCGYAPGPLRGNRGRTNRRGRPY